MADERIALELRFAADARLAAAASAAAEHFAQRREMELGPRAAFVAAVEEACNSTSRLLESADQEILLRFEDFADRLEVTLDYAGDPLPSVGLETFTALGAGAPGSAQPVGLMLLTLVDRVGYETVAGKQRMTLVKYLRPELESE